MQVSLQRQTHAHTKTGTTDHMTMANSDKQLISKLLTPHIMTVVIQLIQGKSSLCTLCFHYT